MSLKKNCNQKRKRTTKVINFNCPMKKIIIFKYQNANEVLAKNFPIGLSFPIG